MAILLLECASVRPSLIESAERWRRNTTKSLRISFRSNYLVKSPLKSKMWKICRRLSASLDRKIRKLLSASGHYSEPDHWAPITPCSQRAKNHWSLRRNRRDRRSWNKNRIVLEKACKCETFPWGHKKHSSKRIRKIQLLLLQYEGRLEDASLWMPTSPALQCKFQNK